MAGPETEGTADGAAPDDVVRPGTGVVRPGTGVVRPGSAAGAAGTAGVVRPATGTDGAAKAVAAVPDAPEQPLEPIHVVLPVIEVKPAKQGFLDRLVAGKTDAEKAEEAARKEEQERRKAEEVQRRAEEVQRRAEEKALREQEEADRRAEEKARKEEAEARREAREARKAEAEAERKARAEAEEKARKQAEKARRVEEKARRAQERALRRAAEEDLDEDEYDDEDDDDYYGDGYEPPARVLAPPRPGPPRPAPGPTAPPRPGPSAPPRPAARPMPAPARPMPGPRPQRVEWYDDEPRRRPLWHWVAAAFAFVALGSGSAAVAVVVAPPASVSYQAGIDTGDQAPILSGLDGGASVPTRPGLEAALAPLIATASLGPTPSLTVADVATGDVLWEQRGEVSMKPASATKILTAAAVLATRGPNYRITTRVVAGANPGDVVLVGGGDPSLAISEVGYFRGAARLDQLARQVRDALGGQTPTRVLIDGSLFTGSTVGPSGSGNVNSQVANITALMIDGGRRNPTYRGDFPQYYGQPDLAAGQAFAQALGLPASQVQRGSAPADARVLGEVQSPPIASIVEEMLAESDNTTAELMARQVALAKGQEASFAGAAQATRAVLAELGVPTGATILHDGSGLSHDNRVTTNQLVAILTMAASPEHPELRPLITGLAVAGYSGTLDDEHQRGDAGRGTVRAKTGTLIGVNALAGYLVDADGRLLAFAAIGNDTPSRAAAEQALDRIAERLTSCGCS